MASACARFQRSFKPSEGNLFSSVYCKCYFILPILPSLRIVLRCYYLYLVILVFFFFSSANIDEELGIKIIEGEDEL